MTRNDITQAATDIFRRVLNNPQLELHDGLTAAEVPNWGSLSHVNLMVSIEEYFHIRFTGKDFRSLHNVGDLITLIAKKCNGTN